MAKSGFHIGKIPSKLQNTKQMPHNNMLSLLRQFYQALLAAKVDRDVSHVGARETAAVFGLLMR